MMLGVFIAYWGLNVAKLPVIVVFLIAGGIVFIVGALEEQVAIRPVRNPEALLVTTVGVATLIDGATQRIWGPSPLEVPFFGSNQVVTIFGGRVLPDELWILGFTIVVVGVLMLVGRHTMVGLAMLAIAENREAAQLRGIDIQPGIRLGSVRLLRAPRRSRRTDHRSPNVRVGDSVVFHRAVRIRRTRDRRFWEPPGGLIGGFVVGLAQEYAARYWGSTYSDIAVFALLLIVLLLKPNGLFGRINERAV